MSRKKLQLNCCDLVDADGNDLEFVKKLPSGKLLFLRHFDEAVIKTDAYGYTSFGIQRIFNDPPETVEYLSLYPNGQVYKKTDCPVRTSSYGVENLIQIKVTRRGGKIVRKEFC